MDRHTGYWWSPERRSQSRSSASTKARSQVVTRAAIGADGTKTYRAALSRRRHAQRRRVALYVIDPDGARKVKVDLGANPDIYLARVDWAPDGRTLYVQRENRDQNRLDMLAVDPATGASRVLFSENVAEHWINLTDDFKSAEGRQLDLVVGTDGFRPSLPLRRRAVDAADPAAMGGDRASPASTRQSTACSSPATRTTCSSSRSIRSTISIRASRSG